MSFFERFFVTFSGGTSLAESLAGAATAAVTDWVGFFLVPSGTGSIDCSFSGNAAVVFRGQPVPFFGRLPDVEPSVVTWLFYVYSVCEF